MNDLVRPTALFSGTHIQAVAPTGVLGTVPNPPQQMAQLPVGSTLSGVVVGHDAEGHTLVRTDLGTLSVATKAQLPVNSEVTLQIRSNGNQLHVLIMHSELPQGGAKGTPAALPQAGAQAGTQTGGVGPHNQAAGGGQATPLAAQAGHGPASDLLTLGQNVRAVVQSPAPAALGGIAGGASGNAQPATAANLSTLAAQLAPGSELQLRIASVQAPPAPGAGGSATGAPASASPTNGAPPTGPQSPAAPGAATPGAATPGAATPGAAVTGTTVSGNPGGGPGVSGQVAAYGALQGGAIQAGSPIAAGTTPQPAAPAVSGGQVPGGVLTPNPTTGAQSAPSSGIQQAGAQPAGNQQAPGGPSGATVTTATTPASGVPAAGAIASYAAAGGPVSQHPVPGATANPAVLLAAHGIGQGGGPAVPHQATQPAAQPGSSAAAAPAPNGAAGAAPTAVTGAISGATASVAPGALQFTGTVTTVSHAGQPVLQTPLGTLTLEIRAPLQAGSRIVFELPGGAVAPGSQGANGPGPAALGTLAHTWPALDETLKVLQEVAPSSVAATTLHDAIPQPGSRLTSGLLFFLSALSGGDVTRWIGDQVSQALRGAGRDSLLSRLAQDFGQLGRLADNQNGDWRLFFFPLIDGDQLQQLRLFLRHGQQEQDGDGAQDDEDQTRFVVEVEMSRLGELQLDGLVREKRLDLILRSRAPLPDHMRRDITQIFHEANEITGYHGNIGFQSSLEWNAMPIEAPEAIDTGVLV